MELQHINVKLFVDGCLSVDPARFIDVFHRWIRESVLDELLIDVADYRHVPQGPGVMLIGHQANYSMDQADGRWGLLYNCKAGETGTNAQRLARAFHAAINAAKLLEHEFATAQPLRFCRDTFDVVVNDRALAPNTSETLNACKADIESFVQEVTGQADGTIEPHRDPRRRFGVTVKLTTPFEC